MNYCIVSKHLYSASQSIEPYRSAFGVISFKKEAGFQKR